MDIRSKSVAGRIDGLTQDDLDLLDSLAEWLDVRPWGDRYVGGEDLIGEYLNGLRDIIRRASDKASARIGRDS